MQHCSCIVFLDGDRNSSVHKTDVTVAEIALLRAIHGPDSVDGIKATFVGKEKPSEELARLRMQYSNSNITKEGAPLVDSVYPGRAPQLPKTLADLGTDDDYEDEDDLPAGEAPAETRNLGGRPRKNPLTE
jgi:hypothetical protein